MNKEDIKATKSLLSTPQKIVIIPHKNPDGDAIGSTLGLWHYLKNIGQDVIVIAPNNFPKFLKWMPGQEEIVIFEDDKERAQKYITDASLIFTLDFNHLSRVGFMQESLEAAEGTFIMIDHHQAPADYAKVTYSDVSMSSTCEMVYNFIEAIDSTSKITSDIANCLYTGIMTDTGSFKYSSTTSRTHRVVADLIDKGAENLDIHNKVFDTNSPSRLHILGCALKNMVILEDYHTAYITLSQEELDQNNFKKGDTEGIVNYGLTLDNIIFAVIFIENKDEGIIKISFRSQGDFSVNEFARAHFEGGGHDNAAGGKSDFSLQETTTKFVGLLDSYKDKLKG
ncbi:bifunctional oligoribonuclease/PAP phosphatase NrnA [Cellulophaga sp. 20_2_10]|uniref:DHH family phosphoesterase n=1 Tax=Cellulophaga sp. 20_2_10 TaxID=2942476 RepID=UPI00201A26E7|nr:bifunctional oligoribonuclease/PAP phosphatase NrnA [Cellulophaga sp. 20_2_10]MCL5246084.1 bifunctional oligoribonuclease/PAP phosphatase NrnA [Cellulophaga sp. 20_2_10]